MEAFVTLALFYGSRGNMWPNPPQELTVTLTEWLKMADVQIPHQFWIEEVRQIAEPPDYLLSAVAKEAAFLEIQIFVEREGSGEVWTLHMNWSPDIRMGIYNDLIDAREYFRRDPTQEGCTVFDQMVSLHEVLNGRPFEGGAITQDVAADAWFHNPKDLLQKMSFFARRGFFVKEEEGMSGERIFYWTEEFAECMQSVVEDRRERMLALASSPIDVDTLLSRLDDVRCEQLDALGTLKLEMFDTGQQVRIPNGFLGLVPVALERFVALLASAGVVVAVNDHEHGILGKVWKVDLDKRQTVLDRYHARRSRSPYVSPEPTAPLPRDRQIEQDLTYRKEMSKITEERITKNDARLAEVKREIFQLEGRLALLRANEASLESTLEDDRGGYVATLKSIEALELELTALATIVDEKAAEFIADMRHKAAEMGLDPEKMLAAVRKELTVKRTS